MIRPITCVCFLLACGSGLYVYQSKHRVQVLDRQIEKTVRATDALREQTRALHAEWTLLNDPQRLQLLADQFLSLKTLTPGQFTSMADLGSRLPAVGTPEPVPQEVPVAEAPTPAQREEPRQPASVADSPSPAPAKPASVAATPPPPPPPVAEHRPSPPSPPHPAFAEAPPARPPSPVFRSVAVASPPRAAPPRIVPAALPVSPPGPIGGSALGMARGAAVPPPQPMPVSASQWVTSGGGG
jgi:hypothetical protein